MDGSFISALISIVIVGAIGGLVIWVVGKLNFGLSVEGFSTAFIAAFVIAIIGGVLNWLFGGINFGAGLLAGIFNLVVAAIVLIVSGAFIPGMSVNGFKGALVGAIGIGIVAWLVDMVLNWPPGAAA